MAASSSGALASMTASKVTSAPTSSCTLLADTMPSRVGLPDQSGLHKHMVHEFEV